MVSHVLYELVKVMGSGKSISHISLPIKIFEPRSSIQRIVDLWSGAPVYLKLAAAETADPLERLKYVITFAISSYYMCTSQDKPFNPLLGETHQGSFSDGTRYYCEHTSHHPPISQFLVEEPSKQWRMHGYYEFGGSMGKNSLTSGLRGPNNLDFADGTRIHFNTVDF